MGRHMKMCVTTTIWDVFRMRSCKVLRKGRETRVSGVPSIVCVSLDSLLVVKQPVFVCEEPGSL